MQIRKLLIMWHLAMFTKDWQTENEIWLEIALRQLTATSDARDLADWPGLAAQRPALENQQRLALRLAHDPGIITRADPEYPPRLAEIPQPPLVLFTAGDRALLQTRTLAVVGSRDAGRYTKAALENFGKAFPPDLTIVSGLASGADTMAHEMALAQGLPTIAVLANGLDRVYPSHNRQLQAGIAAGGLLVSEYPPGTWPMPYRFVARNRIIAGLAHGVLVTEARLKSGSLITANMGLETGREVFALPRDFDQPLGAGTNALIQAGAKPVMNARDITDELQSFD
ncbi:DNA-processing protein DprA [Lacticaseibacillus yichunensis]|uniref:DNA-processing protein DprA n=1 Tax=Lacticaseibacillus yichunensis TaxID=2486015 RepID=A0ABW4CSJ8_9LACO|nr:DNA-processing protein DprA [Lacticaseibacillus yichunensis]